MKNNDENSHKNKNNNKNSSYVSVPMGSSQPDKLQSSLIFLRIIINYINV